MAHRTILTEHQRADLFDLPTFEPTLLRHYILANDDIEYILTRRRAHNRFGFALQLCALRFPSRLLAPGEIIPQEISRFIVAQLGLKPDDLMGCAVPEETSHEHLAALRKTFGYKMFSGRRARDLKSWLEDKAEIAHSNKDMARRFVKECRRTHTILPGISIIEHMCADALVAAERRIETRIVDRLNDAMKDQLDAQLIEHVDGRVSRFIWLRQFVVGKNTADINRLLAGWSFCRALSFPSMCWAASHPTGSRACVVRVSAISQMVCRTFLVTNGWLFLRFALWNGALPLLMPWWKLTTILLEKFGGTQRSFATHKLTAQKHLCRTPYVPLKNLGAALLGAKEDGAALDPAIAISCGWHNLETLVSTAAQLGDTMSAEPLAHVSQGYHRFRRYAPRMLRALDIKAASVAEPLMVAAKIIQENSDGAEQPIIFLRRNSKWLRHLKAQEVDSHQLWEVAVMSHLRDSFRSGDIWLAHSRRYGDLKRALVPIEAAKETPRLRVPFDPEEWLNDPKARMADGLKRLATAAKSSVSDLLCMSKMVHGSPLKEHADNDDTKRTARRAAERRR